MNRLACIAGCLIILGVSCNHLAAQQEASAEALAEYTQPGPEHQQLQRLVGNWSTVIKSYFGSPEPVDESKGSATYESILGGRFLRQVFQGKMSGQNFEGIGVSGYDRAQKKYVGTWKDSMTTGIMQVEGNYDVEKHQLVETGTTAGPSGKIEFKLVTDYKSNDEFLFTMFMVQPDGQEQKWMEITYTRKD